MAELINPYNPRALAHKHVKPYVLSIWGLKPLSTLHVNFHAINGVVSRSHRSQGLPSTGTSPSERHRHPSGQMRANVLRLTRKLLPCNLLLTGIPIRFKDQISLDQILPSFTTLRWALQSSRFAVLNQNDDCPLARLTDRACMSKA